MVSIKTGLGLVALVAGAAALLFYKDKIISGVQDLASIPGQAAGAAAAGLIGGFADIPLKISQSGQNAGQSWKDNYQEQNIISGAYDRSTIEGLAYGSGSDDVVQKFAQDWLTTHPVQANNTGQTQTSQPSAAAGSSQEYNNNGNGNMGGNTRPGFSDGSSSVYGSFMGQPIANPYANYPGGVDPYAQPGSPVWNAQHGVK